MSTTDSDRMGFWGLKLGPLNTLFQARDVLGGKDPGPGHCPHVLWGTTRAVGEEGKCKSTGVSGEAQFSPPRNNKGLTEEECARPPATQNPFF